MALTSPSLPLRASAAVCALAPPLALAERGVVSPLRRAGLSKEAVRAASTVLAAREGRDPAALLAAKPSFPCLAVFVPEGAPLTEESLTRAAAERGVGPR